MFNYILAQILYLFALALTVYSSVKKVGRNTLLFINIAGNILGGIHYILLEGYSAAACAFLFVAMLIVYSFKGKTKFLSSLWIPGIFAVLSVVSGILTYQNIVSILPMIVNLLLVVAFWKDQEITIKKYCAVVAFIWIIYNSIIFAFVALIGQIICFIGFMIFIINYYKTHKHAEYPTA